MSKFYVADDPTLFAEVARVLGPDRLAGYLTDSGGDTGRSLRLYAWNAALASAFLPAIGVVEVALRNAIHERLTIHFGIDWFDDAAFLAIDSVPFTSHIARAKRHIATGGKVITPPRIVAQLMFGFWVALLRPTYARSVWPILRPAFPPYTRRRRIADALDPLVVFRNRIAHHEVIYDRQPRAMYERLKVGAGLLSPRLDEWVEHHARVSQLLASGPVRSSNTF